MITPYYNITKYIKYLTLAIVLSLFAEESLCSPYSTRVGYMKNIPDFSESFTNENEQVLSVKDLKDNVVIIVFFTLWCHNCPSALKSIENLYETLKKDNINNVKIIPLDIGEDTINGIKNHMKAYNIQLLDIYHPIPWKAVQSIRGVPACIVFDKNGKAIWGYLGGDVDFNSSEFVQFIKKHAKE